MSTAVPLNLLTALPAEAKPLIALLGLKRNPRQHPFPVYNAPGISLAISGVGIRAMHEASRYLLDHSSTEQTSAWLNIGICGHGSLALGESLIAQRVIRGDQATWDLLVPPGLTQQAGTLCCVEQPQADYRPGMAYDMESAGFMTALQSELRRGRIGLLKVVSDNPYHGSDRITAQGVRELIAQQAAFITDMIDWLTRND
ncbi:MAG: hypothetical protein ABW076_05075 [Candidatus Thiodiazotropha sp.]